VEPGSESALLVLTLVTDIMKELTLQIMGQFFVTMKVLSGRSPFGFVQSLLEKQIKNIKQTRGSDCVIAYHALVEHLSIYSKDLMNLERVSPVTDAQRVAEDLCINQEWERKEIEERIAECTHHIDDSRVSY